MGKMVDKDELEFIRKMAKEGNLESKLNKGEGILGLPSDIAKAGAQESDDEIAKRITRSMRMPAGMKSEALEQMAKKGLGKGLMKGLGKVAAGIAGGGIPLLAEAMDASDLGPQRGTPEFDMEDPTQQLSANDQYFSDLRDKNLSRVANRQPQSIEDKVSEDIAREEKVDAIIAGDKSFEELEEEAAKAFRKQQILSGMYNKREL